MQTATQKANATVSTKAINTDLTHVIKYGTTQCCWHCINNTNTTHKHTHTTNNNTTTTQDKHTHTQHKQTHNKPTTTTHAIKPALTTDIKRLTTQHLKLMHMYGN